MSDPQEQEPQDRGQAPEHHEPQNQEPITEEVDALLVETEERVIVASAAQLPATARGGMVPAVQAAAVAAGGFVAGAAVVGLVNHRHNRALAAGQPRRRLLRRSRGGRVEALQILSTRSLLVDIHLLNNGEQS